MFDNQSLWSRIVIVVINALVIIFSFLIVITYTIHKRLQGNPGRFVQIIFILQLIMSTQIVISEFYGTSIDESNFIISQRWCQCLGFIQILTAVANTLLNCAMILNLWMQIKHKTYDYKKLFNLSIISSFGIGLSIPLLALQKNDIDISVLGNCALSFESDSDTYINVLSIAILVFNFVVIWMIVRRRDTIQIHTEIYHTKVQRFQRKYQNQYVSTNVTYSIIFLLTRIIPVYKFFKKQFIKQEVLLIKKSVCDDSNICREFFTISLSTANLTLALIRITEPIFRKQVKRQFTRQKEDNLNQRLLQPESSQNINQQESIKKVQLQQPSEDIDKVEFHVFPIQSESIDSLEPPQLIKLISSVNQNHRQQLTDTDTILETNNHFPLIICAANYALDDVPLIHDPKTYPFQFNQMQSRRFQIAISDDCYSNRPTIPSVSEIKDQKSFIEPSYDVQVLTYGKVIMATKLKQMFDINLKTVRESLNWYHNMRKFDEVPTKGTSFISSNGLVSIELITTLQKKLMTRGGGLLMSWKKWEDELSSHKGIFLPVIISLQTFIIEDQIYNIVIKLNRIYLDYPVVDHQWENNYILNEFIKNNIMGWMTIKNGVLTKRFLAQKIRDGIKNWSFTKNDYLLDKGEKLRLLDQIKQDQSILQMMGCSYSLQIVFYKHKTNQLNIILSKEQLGFGQSYDQFEPKTPDIRVVGGLEHYDMNTKLGFVKVFWDDSFKQANSDDEFVKLLQTIQENF